VRRRVLGEEKSPDPRILIIDDDEGIRDYLAELLNLQGFETGVAEDGEAGLERFSRGGFGLIITDLVMPGLDGIEVLEQARRHDPDVEVIVLTGYGGRETAIEAMKKGAYDYLQKPTDPDELYLTVRKALERRRLAEENRRYQKQLELLVEKRTSELTETKNFLQSVLDSSLEYSIIAVDREGGISLFNRGAEHLLGWKSGEVRGKDCIALLAPREGEGKKLGLGDLVPKSEKRVHEREILVRRKDRVDLTVSLTVSRLKNRTGKMVGYLLIAKDISEQKALEEEVARYTHNLEHLVEERTEELAKRNRDLEMALKQLRETQAHLVQSEKLASIGQLAAGVAHEINNPIGFVHSNLATLNKYTKRIRVVLDEVKRNLGPAMEEEGGVGELWRKARLDYILEDLDNLISESLEGTLRVKSIVADLKNVSALDRAQLHSTDLTRELESTLNVLRGELKHKADVVREYEEIPAVNCNPQKINQVFLNILMNAAQAIESPPGRITVRTRRVGQDRVAVEIEDNGKGIAKENLPRIFDAFFTSKEIGEGTGLGLAISYRIIKEHGGDIEVESEVGQGTLFRILLPVGGPGEENEGER